MLGKSAIAHTPLGFESPEDRALRLSVYTQQQVNHGYNNQVYIYEQPRTIVHEHQIKSISSNNHMVVAPYHKRLEYENRMNYHYPKRVVYNQDVQPIYSDNPVLVWGNLKR